MRNVNAACKHCAISRLDGVLLTRVRQQMDADWSVNREYYHGETIEVDCMSSYVASGGVCAKSFILECWDGAFRTQGTLLAEIPECHAVVCLDASGQKNTCGEGMCPPFSSVNEDSVVSVSLITGSGLIPADDLDVANARAVLVSCFPSMAPNPLSLFPQDWSDCPEIPAQNGVSSFQSGQYSAYCDDCDWTRNFYCATVRCSLQALPSRPNMVIANTELMMQEYASYGNARYVNACNAPITFALCLRHLAATRPRFVHRRVTSGWGHKAELTCTSVCRRIGDSHMQPRLHL